MPKFKKGDKVWWKVDDVLHEGLVLSYDDGFYAIKTNGVIVLCCLDEEHNLHYMHEDLWNKSKVVNVEVCEVEELCEGTGEPISECQCNVCTSNKPVVTLEGDGVVYVVREEGEPK